MESRSLTVCRQCMSALRQARKPTTSRIAICTQTPSGRRNISARAHNERLRSGTSTHIKQDVKILESLMLAARSAHTVSSQDLNALHDRITELTNSVLKHDQGKLPEEQRVLYVLEQLDELAKRLIDGQTMESTGDTGKQAKTATSALLGSVNARSYPSFLSKASVLNLISEKAEEILRHPNVFITPSTLKAYIALQSLLHQPSSFPTIFHLYAHKPIPTQTSTGSNITYHPASPQKINTAIPTPTANLALATAVETHNLPLAISIIDTTFCTASFRRSKILRQALIPLSGLALAPLAAYTLSTQFSHFQHTMPTSTATGVAFAGIMTYVAAVATMGYITITTANDQMDRVTWAPGVPLWERWVREEERAALDAVAGKWGFEGLEKRGEEEGGEWEGLREGVGLRGMVLDRVSLMEGME